MASDEIKAGDRVVFDEVDTPDGRRTWVRQARDGEKPHGRVVRGGTFNFAKPSGDTWEAITGFPYADSFVSGGESE